MCQGKYVTITDEATVLRGTDVILVMLASKKITSQVPHGAKSQQGNGHQHVPREMGVPGWPEGHADISTRGLECRNQPDSLCRGLKREPSGDQTKQTAKGQGAKAAALADLVEAV